MRNCKYKNSNVVFPDHNYLRCSVNNKINHWYLAVSYHWWLLQQWLSWVTGLTPIYGEGGRQRNTHKIQFPRLSMQKIPEKKPIHARNLIKIFKVPVYKIGLNFIKWHHKKYQIIIKWIHCYLVIIEYIKINLK